MQCNTSAALLPGGAAGNVTACELAECTDQTRQRGNLSETMVTRDGQYMHASGVWAIGSGNSYVPYTATCIPQAGQVCAASQGSAGMGLARLRRAGADV